MDIKKKIRQGFQESAINLSNHLKNKGMQGLEGILQKAIKNALGENAIIEVPTFDVGIKKRNNGKNPKYTKVDIVFGNSVGIELKVIELPRMKNTHAYGALYDVDQIASDYYDLSNSTTLKEGYIVLLLHGSLVDCLSYVGVGRELHNRMFVDYQTSLHFGELHDQLKKNSQKKVMRENAIKAIEAMGFHLPYEKKEMSLQSIGRKQAEDSLALSIITVKQII